MNNWNDCSRCGNDMGSGICGFDKETQQAICLSCWADDHPQGMAPHPNLGFFVMPGEDQPRPFIPTHKEASSDG